MTDIPQGPEPQLPKREEENSFDGEIPVGSGGAPRWLRWLTTFLFLWAIGYLVVSFTHGWLKEAEGMVLVFAGALVAWFLFFTVANRPADP